VSVRIGLAFGPFPFSGPRAFWRWIDACENSAVDSIFLPDRIVGPLTPPETLTTLAAIAGRTSRLKIGAAVLVLPARDPVLLAKECATIDLLSEGRFLPMFGVGEDLVPEWAAMGLNRRNRGARANEMLDVMTALWERDHVDYDGKHYRFHDVTVTPKPKQSPLPFWIGGRSQAAIERTARYSHGWIGGSTSIPEEIGRIAGAIRARARELGRTIEDDHYGAGFNFRFGSLEETVVERIIQANQARMGAIDPGRYLAVGDADTILARIAAFRDQGISKFVLRPIADSDEEMVEQSLRLSREVIPFAEQMG
jgi:probable F420-dependent oxidoreductase